MVFKNKDRVDNIDNISVKLKNGWSLTVHFKEKLINMYQLPAQYSEPDYLDEWEREKILYNTHFALFVEDFGVAAVIAAAKNHDSAPHEIWFINHDTADNLCFIHEIEFNTSSKLIEILISR